MMSMRVVAVSALMVGFIGAAACYEDAPTSPCACTEEYRLYTIEVVDGAGEPVADVIIRRTNLRTSKVLEPGWLGMLEPGVYLVADDHMLDDFSSLGDDLRVIGEKEGATFQADFVFAVPGPCRCHVEKLSGPNTVTFETVGYNPPLATIVISTRASGLTSSAPINVRDGRVPINSSNNSFTDGAWSMCGTKT
jgi:hypothetical protein